MTSSYTTNNSAVMKTVIILVSIIALVLGLVFYKFTQPKILDKDQLKAEGLYLFESARPLSMFNLTQHNGTTFSQENLLDAWTIVFFGYTYCPDVCPTTMTTLNTTLKDLALNYPDAQEKNSLNIIMVTVDPERDTHNQLSNYVPFFNPDFTGLTGSVEEIAKLATNLNMVFAKAPMTQEQVETNNYLVDHSANLALINPQGLYQGFFRPPFKPEKLSRLINQVMKSNM